MVCRNNVSDRGPSSAAKCTRLTQSYDVMIDDVMVEDVIDG